jgi:hypothetical protein
MARKNYEIIDRYGRVVGDDEGTDERGLLRDSYRLRVPLMMRDGLSGVQRAVAEDAAARRFGLRNALELHQPGPRFCTDAAANDAKRQAYLDSVRDLTEAWRRPPADPAAHHAVRDAFARKTNDREVVRVHDTGDAKRDAYLDQKHDLENSWHGHR